MHNKKEVNKVINLRTSLLTWYSMHCLETIQLLPDGESWAPIKLRRTLMNFLRRAEVVYLFTWLPDALALSVEVSMLAKTSVGCLLSWARHCFSYLGYIHQDQEGHRKFLLSARGLNFSRSLLYASFFSMFTLDPIFPMIKLLPLLLNVLLHTSQFNSPLINCLALFLFLFFWHHSHIRHLI